MTAANRAHDILGRRLGRYEVLTLLASGGMASVYVARATGVAGFERLVAIKVLHPHLAYEEEFIHMFLDEARLAAGIRHHNVVATTDISDTEGDGFFIVMDYIEGGHFGSLLAASGRAGERLPPNVSAKIVLEALAGLGAAHQLKDELGQSLELVHRDVSPQNIMVGVDGIARLTDFGVAKAEKRLTSTRAGQLKGKLAYMSPEQASSGFADQRSDLFSMGVILWESLTGRRLFRGENNAATLSKILMEPIPPVSALVPSLKPFDDVVLKALRREADSRFQSAQEFALALREALQAVGGAAAPHEVSGFVKRHLGERMSNQAEEIRKATERLGRRTSEPTMPVRPSRSTAHSGEQPILVPRDENSFAGALSTPNGGLGAAPNSSEVPVAKRSKWIPLLLIAAVILLAVGIGAWFGSQSGEEEPQTIASQSAADETPATEPAQPAAPVVTPAAAAENNELEAAQDSALGESAAQEDEVVEPPEEPAPEVQGVRHPRMTSRPRMHAPRMVRSQNTSPRVSPMVAAPVVSPMVVTPMVTPMVATPMTSPAPDLNDNPYRQ